MSSFSAQWLELREPYDMRARNPAVLATLATAVSDRGSLAIVDLACGTGATMRAISSRLPPRQKWRLVDNDLGLLERAASAAAAQAATAPIDLSRRLPAALLEPVDLVTTSALLDLVSADWLELLVGEITARGLCAYVALTYDGRVAFEPAEPLDAEIVAAVNRHQRGDKGFGPALGPTAALQAIARFEARGYTVESGNSDWTLASWDRKIQGELVAGWADAASETGGIVLDEIDAWLARRRARIAEGRSSIEVGHIDFFACPTGARRALKSQSNNTSSPSG